MTALSSAAATVKSSTVPSMPTSSSRAIGRRSATVVRSASSRPPGEHQTRGRADERQQHALGEHLADQPAAAGAERRADRQLALTRRRPREHEVADVRARDEQHEPDRAEHHPERRPDLAGQLLPKRHHVRRPAGVELGKQARELGVHARHVLLRLRHRHAVLDAADDADPASPRRSRRRREADGGPDVDRLVEDRESRRHHADDEVGPAVEHDAAIDDATDRRRSAAATADR